MELLFMYIKIQPAVQHINQLSATSQLLQISSKICEKKYIAIIIFPFFCIATAIAIQYHNNLV